MGISHFTFLSVTIVSWDLWKRDKVIYCDGWQRNKEEAGLWEEEKCPCSCGPLREFIQPMHRNKVVASGITLIRKVHPFEQKCTHITYFRCGLAIHISLQNAHLIFIYFAPLSGPSNWPRWNTSLEFQWHSLMLAFTLHHWKINERCERDPWKGGLHCCQFTSRMCANDFMCFYLNEGFSYYPLLMHIHVVVNQPSSTVLCFLISDRILKTSTTFTEFLQGLWGSLTSFFVEILI